MNKMHTLFKCRLKTLKMDDILSPKGNPNKFQVVKIILTTEAIKVHLCVPCGCVSSGFCWVVFLLTVHSPVGRYLGFSQYLLL